jgi:hypothetical protein
MSNVVTETEGDTFSKGIIVTDEDGNAIDITGWVFYVTVKEDYTDADADAVLSQDVSTHDAPTKGETGFTFDNDETEGLEGRYVFEVKYEDTSGTVETVLSRTLRFQNAVREDI